MATKLKVRRPTIDLSTTPKYWINGDAQATHVLNILNYGIPAGERFFIDGVRLSMKYVSDPDLLADARAFVGQETVHARMHEKAANHLGLFEYKGIQPAVDRADAARVWLYKRVDALPDSVRKRVTFGWLSATMMAEHVTAILADMLHDETKHDRTQVDPAMDALLSWHAAEEMEHRTLPYDIYNHIGGSYLARVIPMVPLIPLFPVVVVGLTDFVMRRDPDLKRGFSVRNYVKAVRAKRSLNLFEMTRKLPVYLKPGFHPSHEGDDSRPIAYLASSNVEQRVSVAQ
jgi:predicted metal-dependent hydrolase